MIFREYALVEGLTGMGSVLSGRLDYVGFLSKLPAADIAVMNRVHAEAIRAPSASRMQWSNCDVQPQVRPRLICPSMYLVGISKRKSTMLGLVGRAASACSCSLR